MDANTIRIILIVTGAVLISLLYWWERQRSKEKDTDDDHDRWEDDDEDGSDDAANPDAPYGVRASKSPSTPDDDAPAPPPARVQSPPAESGKRSQPTAPPVPAKPAAVKPVAKPLEPKSAEKPAEIKSPAASAAAVVEMKKPALDPLLIQVSVMSGRGHTFRGPSVLDIAESCGLHPGKMDIFHCLDEFEDETRVYFSMANLVKPGTFPFDAMDDFTTPGLVLFAQLCGRPEDMTILDEMIATARKLAISLRGDVLDDMRCSLTVKKQDEMRKAVIANQLRWAKETQS